ncbi:MAG: ATP-binding cassette domain-containing protein [Jiangellales bacterium]
MAGDELAVDVGHVVTTFGTTTALAGLDLQVRRGEVHAFLGPNGACKTTTLRLLLGMLRADSATMRPLGMNSWTDVAVRSVGGSASALGGDRRPRRAAADHR